MQQDLNLEAKLTPADAEESALMEAEKGWCSKGRATPTPTPTPALNAYITSWIEKCDEKVDPPHVQSPVEATKTDMNVRVVAELAQQYALSNKERTKEGVKDQRTQFYVLHSIHINTILAATDCIYITDTRSLRDKRISSLSYFPRKEKRQRRN